MAILLVRIMIAKVEKKERFVSIVRNTPIRQDMAGWSCVGWVQEVLQGLEADEEALGTGVTEWATVKIAAMEYCEWKMAERRFNGQVNYDMTQVPTYDLIERKETIS